MTNYTHPEFATDASLAERMQALPAHVVYGQLMGRPSWGDAMQRLVPSHMHDGFVRYIAYGNRMSHGGFMSALMSNDLMRAFNRADDMNARSMQDWVKFLFNYAPASCYGSQEKFSEWTGVLVEEENA